MIVLRLGVNIRAEASTAKITITHTIAIPLETGAKSLFELLTMEKL